MAAERPDQFSASSWPLSASARQVNIEVSPPGQRVRGELDDLGLLHGTPYRLRTATTDPRVTDEGSWIFSGPTLRDDERRQVSRHDPDGTQDARVWQLAIAAKLVDRSRGDPKEARSVAYGDQGPSSRVSTVGRIYL